MFWWKKRNEGFEWRDYVRTTILVRREHRRQKLKDVQEAAAANVKKAGKRSVEASVSGARNAGQRRLACMAEPQLARWRRWGGYAGRSAASRIGERRALDGGIGRRTRPASRKTGPTRRAAARARPRSASDRFLGQPGARLALAALAILTALGAAYRTWGFGFDADARLAAVVSVVSAALLLVAYLTDPRRAPSMRDRDGLLTRLGAKGP